jgi:hypothetical protein
MFRELVQEAGSRPQLWHLAEECAETGTLDVCDYSWVSEILQMRIRVTVDRVVQSTNSDRAPQYKDVVYAPSTPCPDHVIHLHLGNQSEFRGKVAQST